MTDDIRDDPTEDFGAVGVYLQRPGRSWHIRRAPERTLCGRLIPDAREYDSPPSGKSCESCLRLAENRRAG